MLYVIIAYLMLLIGVGYYRGRGITGQEDFMVAGRKLSTGVLVGTLLATWIGTGSLMAGGGLAYEKGFSALWFDAGVWVALIVVYMIAGRVRRFAQFTVPDILETRYNATARVLSTIVTIIAYTAIVSYQFRAGGIILNLLTGMSVDNAMILTAVFVIAYTALAGMISVAYTDVVNGIIMTIGLFIALPFLYSTAGGWEGITARLPETHFTIFGDMSPMSAIAYALPTMLLIMGESGMYQRFFSARDEGTAKRAVIGWIIGTVVIETVIIILAVIGSSIFPDINPEHVILFAVRDSLPTVIAALCLAAIVAVIVSTADSFLLVPSTNLVRDVYQRFINPDATQRQLVLYSRLAVLLLGIVAFVQVRFFESILEMAIYAYTVYGVGITPALLAAFFWKRATAAGGVSSIAAGGIVTIGWELVGKEFAMSKFDMTIETIYPALIASLAALIFVSLMTKKPDPSKWAPFIDDSSMTAKQT